MQYKICDASLAQNEKTMIVHLCNDAKIWGAGFVLALAKRYPEAKEAYMNANLALGDVQFVQVDDQVIVANMIAQKGIIAPDNPHPIDYDALDQSLEKVFQKAHEIGYDVQMPKIGAGLAGGDWTVIEKIIKKHQASVNCTICLLKE